MKEKIVISLGGSIIVPGEINVNFIKEFRDIILRHVKTKDFYIIVGGGKTYRNYNDAVKEVIDPAPEALDSLGIAATRLNAILLKTIFAEKAAGDLILDPTNIPITEKGIIFGGGWKPGWSTDFVATKLASELGVKQVINITNIDYIFDKDPRQYEDAKPLPKLAWAKAREIIGSDWVPGANFPFDPIACKLAEEEKMKVVIINGANLSNLDNCLQGKEFTGSIIT